jgi:hypothetical protein
VSCLTSSSHPRLSLCPFVPCRPSEAFLGPVPHARFCSPILIDNSPLSVARRRWAVASACSAAPIANFLARRLPRPRSHLHRQHITYRSTWLQQSPGCEFSQVRYFAARTLHCPPCHFLHLAFRPSDQPQQRAIQHHISLLHLPLPLMPPEYHGVNQDEPFADME